MDQTLYAELKTYLRRLGWSLASLPERDRDDIVEETRVHVLARVEQGQDLKAALASLGTAEAYASRFIDEMEISGALAAQRPAQLLLVVLRRAHRSLTAGVAFLLVLFLGVWGVGGVIAAAMKPFDPEHVGMWISPHNFFLGSTSRVDTGMHEILGNGVYPFAVINLVVAWFLARVILLWTLKTLRRKA